MRGLIYVVEDMNEVGIAIQKLLQQDIPEYKVELYGTVERAVDALRGAIRTRETYYPQMFIPSLHVTDYDLSKQGGRMTGVDYARFLREELGMQQPIILNSGDIRSVMDKYPKEVDDYVTIAMPKTEILDVGMLAKALLKRRKPNGQNRG